MKRRSSPKRSLISCAGRDQFSEERVDRQVKRRVTRDADDAAQRLHAAAVAFDAGQSARGRPSPVAVHDDRRHAREGIDLILPVAGAAAFGII